jgi:hypothetical protein
MAKSEDSSSSALGVRKGKVSESHEILIQAWECAFLGSPVAYLSGPITTGPRFVRWYSAAGRELTDQRLFKLLHRQNVIDANTRDIREAAVHLRSILHEPVLEPASLVIPQWTQDEYIELWARVIERFASRIIMMPGWEYSSGCTAELLRAFTHDVPATTLDGAALSLSNAVDLISEALGRVDAEQVPITGLRETLRELRKLKKGRIGTLGLEIKGEPLRKDASLDKLADVINVAQFVSFAPYRSGLRQEYARVIGSAPNYRFNSLRHALGTLLEKSAEKSINLRSYTPDNPQSREFIYGIRSTDEAVSSAERLAMEGLYVIANETVDVRDGGVSGVIMGDVIEFTPDDTPRGVEKPGSASLPRLWGLSMLSTVYGFRPEIEVPRTSRLEFSIHPKPRGWRHTHTLGWEYAEIEPTNLVAKLNWPNRFSRMLGDKVYGLLVAHFAGLPVPQTKVINRRIAPFDFGRPTGSNEVWIRTSPTEQVPGKFTTAKGWHDPFSLLRREDPNDSAIASVLCQLAVPSAYSGAAIVTSDGQLVIEGKEGEGDTFMQGLAKPEQLPEEVLSTVAALHTRASTMLGPVRLEWAYDKKSAWVLQLHRGATQSIGNVIVPGEADHWVAFDVDEGLEMLRSTIASLESGAGLILRGEVGLTSHIADVVRRAGVPTKLVPKLAE